MTVHSRMSPGECPATNITNVIVIVIHVLINTGILGDANSKYDILHQNHHT